MSTQTCLPPAAKLGGTCTCLHASVHAGGRTDEHDARTHARMQQSHACRWHEVYGCVTHTRTHTHTHTHTRRRRRTHRQDALLEGLWSAWRFNARERASARQSARQTQVREAEVAAVEAALTTESAAGLARARGEWEQGLAAERARWERERGAERESWIWRERDRCVCMWG